MSKVVNIREKQDPVTGFVFVLEGSQTLFGKLNEDAQGHSYLDPVYVYRIVEEFKVDPETKQRTHSRFVRELHPLFGYPEIHRWDLRASNGVSVNELLPENRAELALRVEEYEERNRSMGIVNLFKP
jgi:hypothetical protein